MLNRTRQMQQHNEKSEHQRKKNRRPADAPSGYKAQSGSQESHSYKIRDDQARRHPLWNHLGEFPRRCKVLARECGQRSRDKDRTESYQSESFARSSGVQVTPVSNDSNGKKRTSQQGWP